MSGERLGPARWWEIRRAANLKPTTYRCPLCGHRLPALTEHLLMFPEGRSTGRRHAHTECVMAARKAGRLPTREEWRTAARPGGDTARWPWPLRALGRRKPTAGG